MADSHLVPVPSSIVPHELVHGEMDNFDHKGKFLASEEATTLSSCYFKTLKIRTLQRAVKISKKDVSNEIKGLLGS